MSNHRKQPRRPWGKFKRPFKVSSFDFEANHDYYVPSPYQGFHSGFSSYTQPYYNQQMSHHRQPSYPFHYNPQINTIPKNQSFSFNESKPQSSQDDWTRSSWRRGESWSENNNPAPNISSEPKKGGNTKIPGSSEQNIKKSKEPFTKKTKLNTEGFLKPVVADKAQSQPIHYDPQINTIPKNQSFSFDESKPQSSQNDWTRSNWLRGEPLFENSDPAINISSEPKEGNTEIPCSSEQNIKKSKEPFKEKTKLNTEGFLKPVVADKAQRMMQMMGWQGGALGTKGNGITEPIMPHLNHAKGAGLGHNAKNKPTIQKQPKSKKQPQPELIPLKLIQPKTKQKKQKNKKQKNKNKPKQPQEQQKTHKYKQKKGCIDLLYDIREFVQDRTRVTMIFDASLTKRQRLQVHQSVGFVMGGEDIKIEYDDHELDVLGEIMDYNSYMLSTKSFGVQPDRQLHLFKEAHDHVYLITKDDFNENCVDEDDDDDVVLIDDQTSVDKTIVNDKEKESTNQFSNNSNELEQKDSKSIDNVDESSKNVQVEVVDLTNEENITSINKKSHDEEENTTLNNVETNKVNSTTNNKETNEEISTSNNKETNIEISTSNNKETNEAISTTNNKKTNEENSSSINKETSEDNATSDKETVENKYFNIKIVETNTPIEQQDTLIDKEKTLKRENRIKNTLYSYFIEFCNEAEFTEMRFLGNFDVLELSVINEFVKNIYECTHYPERAKEFPYAGFEEVFLSDYQLVLNEAPDQSVRISKVYHNPFPSAQEDD